MACNADFYTVLCDAHYGSIPESHLVNRGRRAFLSIVAVPLPPIEFKNRRSCSDSLSRALACAAMGTAAEQQPCHSTSTTRRWQKCVASQLAVRLRWLLRAALAQE